MSWTLFRLQATLDGEVSSRFIKPCEKGYAMELKVVCNCGQKYKFDVEPANGRMPFAVNCPVCGVDGTPLANALLTQSFPRPTAVALPAAPAVAPLAPLAPLVPVLPPIGSTAMATAATPPPLPAVAMASAPAAPAPVAALRINKPAPPPLPAAAPVAEAVAAAVAMPAPIVVPAKAPVLTGVLKKPKSPGEFNMGLGVLGAFLGAGLGCGLMYAFYMWARFRFPLMGAGIGALSGLGARILFKGTSSTLGAITAVIALAATAGTLFLIYGDFAGLFIITMVVSASMAYKIAG